MFWEDFFAQLIAALGTVVLVVVVFYVFLYFHFWINPDLWERWKTIQRIRECNRTPFEEDEFE